MTAPAFTQDAGRRFREMLVGLVFASPLYGAALGGRTARLRGAAPDPWVGEPEAARNLLAGRYVFCGEEILAPNLPPWAPQGVSEAWAAELHGFAWLRDLAADGSPASREAAVRLVGLWLGQYRRWHPLAWRPDVLGRRLLGWLGHAEFLLSGATPEAEALLLDGLARQTRHLARSAAFASPGPPRLTAAIGLVAGTLSLGLSRRALGRGLDLMAREIGQQVLGDGGHASRNPATHLAVLRDLIQARGVLMAAHHEVPEALQNAIDRLAPMLRFFRHGDGRLALFNGSREGVDGLADQTLVLADAPGRALTSARHSGFERLVARRTLVLLDAGVPAPAATFYGMHAGLLAFELSVGRERLIVNGGAPERPSVAWTRAMRATAAHSTLTLADTNAVHLDDAGRLKGAAPMVAAERSEAEGSVWIEAYHEGYRESFGLVHRRRLYLDESGEELRGEDSLIGRPRHPLNFAIRFHLHPQVHASLVQNGAAALFRLPGGSGFRLVVSSGSELRLEESIYLGAGPMRRNEQVVIHGIAEGEETIIKWFLTRIAASRGSRGRGDQHGEL